MQSANVSPLLAIDVAAETARICQSMRDTVFGQLRRKGVVVGVSGGIDSSVVAGLAVRALGKERVFALFTPEMDSSSESLQLGQTVTDWLEISSSFEDISPILRAAGCYRRRDKAIRSVVPEFNDDYKCKLVLPNMLETGGYPVFSIVVQSPAGDMKKVRLPLKLISGS